MLDLLEWLSSVAFSYGYLGVFLASVIAHASILFPIPSYLVVYALGATLDPFLLGVFAGVGAAIGELTSYAVGYGVEKKTRLEDTRFGNAYSRTKKVFNKYGFWSIPVFAATPLPTDVLGLGAGLLKYSAYRFFLGCLMGKLVMHWVLAYAGRSSFQMVMRAFSGKGVIIGWLFFALIVLVLLLVIHRINDSDLVEIPSD